MAKVAVKLVSWDEIADWARDLSSKILESGWRPDVVMAIARGGYVPARLVCDNLGVMDLVSVQVVHWPSTAQAIERAFIKHEARVDSLAGKRVLVIDDIVDTGDSISLAKEYAEKAGAGEVRSAALQWISTVAKFKPDYYSINVTDWKWFVYPWNVTEDVTNFMKRIIMEEGASKNRWGFTELVSKMREWYGDEIMKVPLSYISKALINLEQMGLIERSSNGAEYVVKGK
ncbi:phosphoribosyltransferase [Thermocladium modestius]|uniref:Phosphoribosyltransferase n=1 Tax=Thermocladium modestius TaxID=62609 RepID=A0A830GV66_9CREN|nr:phosphoribosyltransferase [Thermocladium modestius]GGP21406.1 phosphoribosyltransferase [Thermocladium modestius]